MNRIHMLLYCFSKRKTVKFGKHINIDLETSFEGNNVIAGNCSFLHSDIGYGSYIANGSFIRNTIIGRYCCIGKNVRIIDVTHPTKCFVSTHPSFFSLNPVNEETYVNRQKFEEIIYHSEVKNRSVVIENDVWIGDGVQILGGHTIGNGAIVAAGAIVTKDVEPYTIVAGVPAKEIRKRFSEEQIEILENSKWWNKGKIWIQEHAEQFENIELFCQMLIEDGGSICYKK